MTSTDASPPLTTSLAASDPPLARLLIALTLLVALVTAALAFRENVQIYTTPLTEDGFYSLAVARNVAAGNGMTIDGEHLTNGFQPLFTMVEAGCYWLAGGHGATAARLVLTASWIVYILTGLLIGLIARDLGSPEHAPARRWIATLLYLGGFLSFMHNFNGLETGSVVLFYAGIARAYQLGWLERSYGPALFGALCGLLVLTRIDAAIFVAVFTGWQFLKLVRGSPVKAFLRAAQIGGVALAISSPWWIYNYTVFGALMPTSGTAQQAFAFSLRRLAWLIWALSVDAMPTLWFGKFDETFDNELFLNGWAASILRIAIVAGLALLLRHRFKGEKLSSADPVRRRTIEFGLVMGAALAVMAAYYGLTFIAFWFYYRYLFPVVLPATVLLAWTLAPYASRRIALSGALASLLIAPTVISAVMAQRGHTLHVETVYWDQLALIDSTVPRDDYVAAGQAGTLGYFRPRVVNVDGKVNRAVVARQERMWEYLAQHDVRWFADWHNYVTKYLGDDPTEHGWRKIAHRGIWELWHYEGDASGAAGPMSLTRRDTSFD
jgi:hypothetical protein